VSLIQLLTIGDYIAKKDYGRMWVKPGVVMNLGHGVTVSASPVREDEHCEHVMQIEKCLPGSDLKTTITIPLQPVSLVDWCGIRVVPRAVNPLGSVLFEFQNMGGLSNEKQFNQSRSV